MGIKIVIFILLSISIQASNLDNNISKTTIDTTQPQKIVQTSIKKENFSTNSKNKTSIDETIIRNIAKDEYLKNFNQTQLSYQNAIIGTNNNITKFSIGVTVFGVVISIIMFVFGWRISQKIDNIIKDTENKFEIFRQERENKFEKYKTDYNSLIKNYEKTIEDKLNNKIGEKINKEQKSIQKEFDKIKRTINRKDTDYIKSEILLNLNDIHRLKTLSDNLLYSINKILVLELKTNEPSKALAKYNTLFKKYTEITSLQDNIVIDALGELSVDAYKELKNLKETKVYLEALKDYTDNMNLKTKINNFLNTLKR